MCSENLLSRGRRKEELLLQGRAVLRQWLFRSSIQLFVRQVGVQELCLSEGSDVREVVDLHSRG